MTFACGAALVTLLASAPQAAVSRAPAYPDVQPNDAVTRVAWDPRSRRVFAEIVHSDESGDPSTIVVFDLRRRGGEKPIKFMIDPSTNLADVRQFPPPDDGRHDTRADSLFRRLDPLAREPHLSKIAARVLMSDTLWRKLDDGREDFDVRYHLRIESGPGHRWSQVLFTAFAPDENSLIAVYRIPSESRFLGVLSGHEARGMDAEGPTEVPVLLPGPNDPPLVLDEVDPR